MAVEERRGTYEEARRIRGSLDASRREGVCAQVPLAVLDYYLVPFALLLGASAREVSMLIAVPSLLAAVSQFFVVDVLRAVGQRRRLLLWATVLQAAALAPLPAIALAGGPSGLGALLALVSFFRVVGALMGPAWGSLMSDHLPESRRGRYFGDRSQLVGVAGIATIAACGALFHLLRGAEKPHVFAALFAAACAFRAVSFKYMRMLVDLPEHESPRVRFDWRAFRGRLRESNFARFVMYVTAVTFAAQLTAAWLSVHMLRDLGFGYARYTAVQLASAAAGFLSFPAWGRHADRVGNARVLRLNSFLMPLIPLLWTLTESPAGLFAVEAFGGFVWAGFNLCSTNFLYDSVAPHKRVRALGYLNLLNGAASFAGAGLGGLLADALPPVGGYRLHALFLVGAAVRFLADFLIGGAFREVRASVERVSSAGLFFSVVGLRPMSGTNVDTEWDAPGTSAQDRTASAMRR